MKSVSVGLTLCGMAMVQSASATSQSNQPPRLVQTQTQQPAPTQEPVITTSRSVNLTEEERYTIREVVLKDSKVPKQAKEDVTIGDPAPSGVTTERFPEMVTEKIPSLRNHTYFVTDGGVVIVDRTNKVADIVKAK
jgi:hypothetical protein